MAIQEHLQIAQVGIFVRHLIITCLILSIIIISTIVVHCPDGWLASVILLEIVLALVVGLVTIVLLEYGNDMYNFK